MDDRPAMPGSVINYPARSTLAVAAPTLLAELHIDARQYSWIVGTFQGAVVRGLGFGILTRVRLVSGTWPAVKAAREDPARP